MRRLAVSSPRRAWWKRSERGRARSCTALPTRRIPCARRRATRSWIIWKGIGFLNADNVAEKVLQAAEAEGVLTYPTQGCVEGHRGDHLLLAPPFTISEEECKLVENVLSSALKKVFPL